MRLYAVLSAVAGFLIFLTVACSRDNTTADTDSATAAVEQQMLAPDNYDSAKAEQEEKEREEELPTRYVAYSSNEAIELMESLPDADKYMQGILPRMSQESLDYAMRLLNNAHDGFIIVDKESMQLGLYDRYGREKLRYGIACARNYGTKHGKGDSRTPEGFFSVQGVYDSTDWLFRDDNGRVSKVKGQFGPRFIRLSIPGTTQIGIHGTRAPGSIGRRTSHGCIRVTNEHILELVKHVSPGMPVIVSPSRRDEKVNRKEGYDIPWVSVSGGRRKAPLPDDPVVKKKEQRKDSVVNDSVASHTESELPAEPVMPATPAEQTQQPAEAE